jgi:hypothetical protein
MSLAVIGRNVRWGIGQGVAFAAIASVAVTLFEIPRWEIYRPHIWLVVGSYFAAGISVGAVVGLLRQLTRWLIGAILVGIIAAVPFAVVLGMFSDNMTFSPHVDLRLVVELSLICGPMAGFIRWNQTWGRSAKTARHQP